jgi:hypothetical protein
MGLLHVLQKVGTFCVHRIGKREDAIFANRNFFFWDYRHRLPLPDAWLVMAIKYVLGFIFFMNIIFVLIKKNLKGVIVFF